MRSASNSATIASTLNNNRPGQPVEFGDDQVLPSRQAASASRRPGRSWLQPVNGTSTIDDP
jgi:hypothetical protein